MTSTTGDADERCLVARARRGDERAFEELVARYAPYVHALALRTLGDGSEAEDAAQEAFIRAWNGLAGFREDARLTTWLYRIVTRVCCDRMPRLRRELAALPSDVAAAMPDESPAPDATVIDAETRARLWAAVDRLPPNARLLLALRHRRDLSYAEIAEVTGLPVASVKVGIHRARQRLRRAIQDGEDADDLLA